MTFELLLSTQVKTKTINILTGLVHYLVLFSAGQPTEKWTK